MPPSEAELRQHNIHWSAFVENADQCKSGLAEKYVIIVQDMYDDSTTAVTCAVGVTKGFEAKVGLVPARYVRQSQLCPQLDVSDKNDKKTQDMSDRARYVLHKM